jgi:hypothetical protein
MDHSQHNRNVNFIWSIAEDELRDVYVRGKYRDVTRCAEPAHSHPQADRG